MKNMGKKAFNIDLPVDLYNMFAKLCVDYGITKTEGIIRYLKFLQKQHHRERELLNERSRKPFKLDDKHDE